MNKREHIKADLSILGYTNPRVHELMDFKDALEIFGNKHRKHWGHNPRDIMLISFLAGGDPAKNLMVGLNHLLMDEVWSYERKKRS